MTTNDNARRISALIQQHQADIGADWIANLESMAFRSDSASQEQLRRHCRQLLALLPEATLGGGFDSIESRAWDEVRDQLTEISGQRAKQGSTPSETATFVFSLKQSLFGSLRQTLAGEPELLAEALWNVSTLLDKLGLFTIEVFQKSRDQIIVRQQQELLELSTPVVKLWTDILALPLIGTLDSARTQVVMELSLIHI